jgi:hypothetical protein
MAFSAADVPPLLPAVGPAEAMAILSAMRGVAAPDGAPSGMAERSVGAAARYVFGDASLAVAAGGQIAPDELAAALPDPGLGDVACRFLGVMALVDGIIDPLRIAMVQAFADALRIEGRYLGELAALATGGQAEALSEMTALNMESITNAPWQGGDVNVWLRPYENAADPALAARFAALGELGPETIGHTLWAHFRHNHYGFPGEPDGLNAAFGLPHDTLHVLTGYNTRPDGEILVSTFTAAAHPVNPMEGHILPVLVSWHVGARINNVAGDATGALDPEEFWHAWAAGAAARVDTFAPGWDFWAVAGEDLRGLRRRWAIPEDGLVPHGDGGVA